MMPPMPRDSRNQSLITYYRVHYACKRHLLEMSRKESWMCRAEKSSLVARFLSTVWYVYVQFVGK